MITRKELVESKEYILAKIQTDLYEAVNSYLKTNNMTKSDFAKQLGVSKGYVSQILNGDFDHKLSKIITLSLAIGKVPVFNMIDSGEKEKSQNSVSLESRSEKGKQKKISQSYLKKGSHGLKARKEPAKK